MNVLVRMFFLHKHLFLLSAFILISACSNFSTYNKKNHSTIDLTYDLFSTAKGKTALATQALEIPPPFSIDVKSNLTELEQLSSWLSISCQNLLTSWQSCIQSLAMVKKYSLITKNDILALTDIPSRTLFLAVFHQNKAELASNKYNDRKYKIQAAHNFVLAKKLLEEHQTTHLTQFRQYLIHFIELQLSNMVKNDEFLTILISKPLLLGNSNHSVEYSMLNWSANALNLRHPNLKKIRKNNPRLSFNTCLISLENAVKFQNKLDKKRATILISKRDFLSLSDISFLFSSSLISIRA